MLHLIFIIHLFLGFRSVNAIRKDMMMNYMHATQPIVVNTWPLTGATDAAWDILSPKSKTENSCPGTAMDAVVAGCSAAEEDPNITSVGYGCSPDEEGHTSLDAMVMDGRTMEVT